ncbi:unnamed protein product [Peniophora sp. CBMAI 1063]|nr:unnamed protein product [Peniophora sp. CBMAI 1063]
MAANAAQNDQQRYYAPHLQSNALALANVKFFSACFAGAAAGVLGLENWAGFSLFAFATILTTTILSLVNYKGKPTRYVKGGVFEIANPGQENLASFILAWTLFYGIVHVYD